MLKTIFLSFFLLITTTILPAQNLKLPLVFDDHMVLQREADIRIWGWADAHTKVTVKLGDVSRTTAADFKDGRWETLLPPQKAGGPYTISISTDEEHVMLNDIYIGDVWVAGGQSNMEWKLSWVVENWEEEVANSGDFPEIRFFDIPQTTAYEPQMQIPGGEWKIANPDNAGNFSAVAWYFAKLNHAEKDVPVGIIESNWGGTPAESWTPAHRLLQVEGYKEKASEMLQKDVNWDLRLAKNDSLNTVKYQRVEDQNEFLKYGAHEFDYDDTNWQEVNLPNEEPLYDFVWLRKSITVDNVDDARLSLGNPGKFTVAFINGHKVYRKIWSDDPKVLPISKSILKEGKNVIAIRTVEDWNNQTFIGKVNDFWIEIGNERFSLEGAWKFSNTVEPPMPEVIRYEHSAGTLYNAMIHPLAGYTIAGAIWYQGESNVGANQYYNELFEAMIEEWRKSWKQGYFPFLYVQLANFLQKQDEPYDSGWARLREAQTQTLSLANTGMATIIDIGDAEDIHPRNKHDVGKRLWLAAEKVAYGEKLVFSGPMYRGHVVEGNKIRIAFDHTGSGLTLDAKDKRLGFAIAGSDRKFHWPSEVKIEGNQVVIWSKEIDHPAAVRYAWADNPDVSLYNQEGLPAVPFRTDNW